MSEFGGVSKLGRHARLIVSVVHAPCDALPQG